MPPAFEVWAITQWVRAIVEGRVNYAPAPDGAGVGDRVQIVPAGRSGPIYEPGMTPMVRILSIEPFGRVWQNEMTFELLGVDG